MIDPHAHNPEFEDNTFRNSIGTIERDGARKWIYPKKVSGRFYNYRTYVSWVLLVIFFAMPFLKRNGNQLFKFDFIAREFFIFGNPLFIQDFAILAIAGITTMVFIILFTVIFGRLFCGWICPQTIFMEMVFRKIEYAIEGDRNKQIRLDKQPWDTEKITKKSLKWSIFLFISFLIANLFLAYLVGSDKLINLVNDGPSVHISTFFAVVAFTGVFYFVFAWFREQACTMVCPYGRFQGVLVDKKTISVTYDHIRGEAEIGRSKLKKGEDRVAVGKGDCIDCKQCVVVCPTGIDIRNGTQLECVNCTACIDACDNVMTKINLPKGLIRYASEENITKKEKFKFTSRIIAYSAVLLILIGVMSSFILMRNQIEVKVLKVRGSDYSMQGEYVVDQYDYSILNKTNEAMNLRFKLMSHKDGKIELVGDSVLIVPKSKNPKKGNLRILLPLKDFNGTQEMLKIGVFNKKGKLMDTYDSDISGPFKM